MVGGCDSCPRTGNRFSLAVVTVNIFSPIPPPLRGVFRLDDTMMTDEDCEIEIASRIYIAGLPPSRRRKECSDTLIRLRAVQKGKLPPYDKDEYMNRYLFIRGYVDN